MKCQMQLKNHGWIDFYFEVNGQEFRFNASYLTEPINDMISSLLYMIPKCVRTYKLQKKSTFHWDEEGDDAYWELELLSESSIKIIVRTDDLGIQLDTVCDFFEFLEIVTNATGNLLKEHGLIGFEEYWGSGFPIYDYLKLRYYAIHKSPLTLEKLKEHSIADKNNLEQEIALLIRLLE